MDEMLKDIMESQGRAAAKKRDMEDAIINEGAVSFGLTLGAVVLRELYKDSITSIDYLVLLEDHCLELDIDHEPDVLENYANWVYVQVGNYYEGQVNKD